MTVADRQIPADEELRRAFGLLARPDLDEATLDQAMDAIARAAAHPAPSRRFARRTMAAIRCAPLADGRIGLRRSGISIIPWLAGLTGASAAVVYAVIVGFGPAAIRLLVQTIAGSVQVLASALVSVKSVLNLWPALATLGTAVAELLTSPQIAYILIATSLVGVFSLTALARLLASDQELSQW